MIYIIREKAEPQQIKDMLQMLQAYIKSMEILDPEVRRKVTEITVRLLGGV